MHFSVFRGKEVSESESHTERERERMRQREREKKEKKIEIAYIGLPLGKTIHAFMQLLLFLFA